MRHYSFIIPYLFLCHWILFPLDVSTATGPYYLKPFKTYQQRTFQDTTHALQVLNDDIKTAIYSVTKRVAVFCNYIQMKGLRVISYLNSILDTLINRAAECRMHNTKSNNGHHKSEIVDRHHHHESEIVDGHHHHESEIVDGHHHHESEIVDGHHHHESEIVDGHHHESEIVDDSVDKEMSVDDRSWTPDDGDKISLLLLEQYDKGGEEHLFELFCKYSKLLLVFLLSAGIVAITCFFAMINLK